MVPVWVPLNTMCRIIIGTPKRDPNFDNHPYTYTIYRRGAVRSQTKSLVLGIKNSKLESLDARTLRSHRGRRPKCHSQRMHRISKVYSLGYKFTVQGNKHPTHPLSEESSVSPPKPHYSLLTLNPKPKIRSKTRNLCRPWRMLGLFA